MSWSHTSVCRSGWVNAGQIDAVSGRVVRVGTNARITHLR